MVTEQTKNISSLSPGDILKRCREFQGMSLEDAAEATKVGIDHLRALEENRCDQFASLAYLKGFVRIYAACLGLNADDIIRLYARQYGVTDSAEIAANGGLLPKKRSVFARFPLQKLIIPLVLLMVVLVISGVINRFFSMKGPPPPVVSPPAIQPVQQVISSTRKIEITSEQKKPATDVDNKTEPVVVPETKLVPVAADVQAKGFVVSLKAVRNSLLMVTVDSTSPQQHELTAGDRIEWQGSGYIVLEISDAGAVEVECNGKPFGPLGADGARKSVTIKSECLK